MSYMKYMHITCIFNQCSLIHNVCPSLRGCRNGWWGGGCCWWYLQTLDISNPYNRHSTEKNPFLSRCSARGRVECSYWRGCNRLLGFDGYFRVSVKSFRKQAKNKSPRPICREALQSEQMLVLMV